MTTKDTGGPAFPATVRGKQEGRNMKPLQRFEGMTLRDHFAGLAMLGVFTSGSDFLNDAEPCAPISKAAYLMADAMLEARK